MKEQSEDDNF